MDILRFIELGAVGLVSGLFASYVANYDHRRRRWWEMRAQAYQRVIELVSEIEWQLYEKTVEYILDRQAAPLPAEKRAIAESAQGQLFKLRNADTFLFSRAAERALADFEEVFTSRDLATREGIDDVYAAAATCRKLIVDRSTIDLDLSSLGRLLRGIRGKFGKLDEPTPRLTDLF